METSHVLNKEPTLSGRHVEMSHSPAQGAVVGSARLFDENSEGQLGEQRLIPRPTNNPDDPMTWSRWRKHVAFASISFFVFLSNYITASISPILITVAGEFGIGLEKASYLITLNILFLGIGNLFWIPLAQKYGKRPVLVVCSILFFVSSVWSAVATSYGSYLGARIVQGFGASSSEVLGVSIVADMYFLHERGAKIGFYTFMVGGGATLGGIFAGLIVRHDAADWRWVGWMNSILTGTAMVLVLLFGAETNFNRPIEDGTGPQMTVSDLALIRAQNKFSWYRSLRMTGWHARDKSLFQLFLRPYRVLKYPAVIWGSFVYGVTLGWVVLQQTANAGFFPLIYNFSGFAVGNILIGSFIGSIIGCLVGGPGSDVIVKFISKRQHGYFTPESRLWCLLPPFVFIPVGLLLWGFGLENALNPYVPIVGTSIAYAVLCAVPTTAMAYVVDCHTDVAADTLTVLTAFKNTVAFGVSFAVVPWIQHSGFARVSGYMTLIQEVLILCALPLYLYGPGKSTKVAKSQAV